MRRWHFVGMVGGVLLAAGLCRAQADVSTAMAHLVDALMQTQDRDVQSPEYGCWPGEEWATGTIAAGLAAALGDDGFEAPTGLRDTCVRAAVHIVNYAEANSSYYGNAAFGLMRVQDVTATLDWLDPLLGYYALVRFVGTERYLHEFDTFDPSMAAFYLAQHVVVVHELEDPNRTQWRQALVRTLGNVDDAAHFPVMALAISTWALAQTGPMDGTLVDPNADMASPWYQVHLRDLPVILLSHRVPAGQADAGTYFWKFNHLGGDEDAIIPSGYTEDEVYATLAWIALWRQLAAADGANTNGDPADDVPTEGTWLESPEPNRADLEALIADGQRVLTGAVQPDGTVTAHVSLAAQPLRVFAGEVLYALCQCRQFLVERSALSGQP